MTSDTVSPPATDPLAADTPGADAYAPGARFTPRRDDHLAQELMTIEGCSLAAAEQLIEDRGRFRCERAIRNYWRDWSAGSGRDA